MIDIQYVTAERIGEEKKRDDRPAEHRWRPLFDAAKFG